MIIGILVMCIIFLFICIYTKSFGALMCKKIWTQ